MRPTVLATVLKRGRLRSTTRINYAKLNNAGIGTVDKLRCRKRHEGVRGDLLL